MCCASMGAIPEPRKERAVVKPLARDILIVLALKVLALGAIYWAFFAHHPRIDPAQHIAGARVEELR
jgi:hypothetical protein